MPNEGYAVTKKFHEVGLFQRSRPIINHLDIELTERCNNACIHCYINQPVNSKQAISRELTTDQWKGILEQAADLGVMTVRFTGGEPLLRDDFTEIYLHARRLGMKVVLFTNARLITPKLADLFTHIPPLKKIEISVYGMHSESYDAVAMSPGAFDEFRAGVDHLLKRKIPFVLKSVLLPPNKDDMDDFEAWAATIPGMGEPGYSVTLDLRARRDSPKKNLQIQELRFTPQETVQLDSLSEKVYRQNMAQFSARFLHPQGDRVFSCGAGEKGCVDAYGNLQMCMLLRHPDFVYNLLSGTLLEGFTQVFPRLRETRATNPAYLERCARCFLKGLCLQCPAKSWAEHGTLDTPVEYLCEVAHAQARFLGLLGNDEYSWKIDNWKERIEKFVQETEMENS
jgi:radical SAM protein with 4Fe4S-binding SPASM domain